jgi:hypothetical protein
MKKTSKIWQLIRPDPDPQHSATPFMFLKLKQKLELSFTGFETIFRQNGISLFSAQNF